MHESVNMKVILQFFKNITKSTKIFWCVLAFIVLLLYLIYPPTGVEYNIGGYFTIRNYRHVSGLFG